MAAASSQTTPFENMAPRCEITINDRPLSHDLVGLIRSVEYESADNMADMARIIFSNPQFVISNLKGLQPGNEVCIWFGYGKQLKFIGRVEIARHHPTYPRAGMPTIEIIGYTADRRMMDNTPKKPQRDKKSKERDSGLSHNGKTYSQVVLEKIEAYDGFVAFDPETGIGTVDDTDSIPKFFFQKYGMSDYDFIRGMANITGYFFWVDGLYRWGAQEGTTQCIWRTRVWCFSD